MTQQPSPAAPTPDPTNPATPPRKKRKLAKWLLISGASLVLLLVLLVLLLPTLLSTGPGKSIVLSQANGYLNGTLQVDSWSLGWFSGVKLKGVRLLDDQKRTILTVGSVDTSYTISKAVRGDMNIGDVVIDRLDLVTVEVTSAGTSNFDTLVKGSADSKGDTTASTKSDSALTVPTANLKINGLQGAVTIVDVANRETIQIEPSNQTIVVNGTTNPVMADLALRLRDRGSVTIKGSLMPFENGQLLTNWATIKGDPKVTFAAFDLATLKPALAIAAVPLTLQGKIDGTLNADLKGGANDAATGDLRITGFQASGAALNGDTLVLGDVAVPLDIKRSTSAEGNRLTITKLGIENRLITLRVTGDATDTALVNLAAQKAPGSPGALDVQFTSNLAELINQLPNTVKLQQGVTLSKADATASAKLNLTATQVVSDIRLNLQQLSGTRNGQPVSIDPVNVTLLGAAEANQAGQLSVAKDLRAGLRSRFANADVNAPTLSQLDATASFDLGLLKQQLGQIVDFGAFDFNGQGQLVAKVTDDPTTGGDLPAIFNVSVTNLQLRGLTGIAELNDPKLEVDTQVLIKRRDGVVTGARADKLVVTSGGAQQALLLDATGEYVMADGSLPALKLNRLEGDLGALTRQYAVLIPQLQAQNMTVAGQLSASSGQLSMTGTKIDLTQGIAGKIDNLVITRNGQPILSERSLGLSAVGNIDNGADQRIFLTQGGITTTSGLLDLALEQGKPIDITLTADGRIRGQGGARLQAKLKPLLDVYTAYAAAPATAAAAGTPAPSTTDIRSGDLLAVFNVQTGETTALVLDSTITNLSVGNSIVNETIKAKLTANTNADFSTLALNGDVASNVIRANISQANLRFSDNGKPLAGLAMLSNAKLTANADDLSKLQALLNALSGTPADPASATVGAGALALTADVSTSGNTLTANVDGNVTGLRMVQNGQQIFAEDKLALGLNADYDQAADNLNLKSASVDTQSSGALKLAASGKISGVSKQRQFAEPLKLQVTYDAAPLLAMVKPFVAVETQQTLNEVKVNGKETLNFEVTGAYPADAKPEDAIKLLAAKGNLKLPAIDYAATAVRNFNTDITLDNGTLTLVKGNGATAKINDGDLNLGGATVNLAATTPRLNVPANTVVIKGIRPSVELFSKLGQRIPSFGGNAVAGNVDVTFNECTNFPLGALATMSRDPATQEVNDGKLDVIVNMTDFRPGGPVFDALYQFAGNSLASSLKGEVRNGRIIIDRGQLTQDIKIIGGDNNQLLAFAGGVNLETQRFQNFSIGLPTFFLEGKIDKNLMKYVSGSINIPVGGTVSAPQLQADALVKNLVGDAVKKAAADQLGGEATKLLGKEGINLPPGLNIPGLTPPGPTPAPANPAAPANPGASGAAQPAQPGNVQPANPQPRNAPGNAQPGQPAAPANPPPAAKPADPVGGIFDLLKQREEEKKKEKEREREKEREKDKKKKDPK